MNWPFECSVSSKFSGLSRATTSMIGLSEANAMFPQWAVMP